jgi:mannitol/fructose-specific phosphotransferase system IIA component (Ntr-type)
LIKLSGMSTPAEHLASILESGVVRIGFHAETFADAVRELLAPALAAHGITGDRVPELVDAVLARERLASTCSGPLALPHARVSGIPEIIAGFGINRDGIYPASGVQFMMAFVSPDDPPADHLRFLSEAARTCGNQGLLDALLDATTPAGAIEIIRSGV